MRLLPRRLYARVTLLVCAILTATVASYAWVTSVQQGARLRAALRDEATAVAGTIARTSVQYLLVQDYASIEELVLEVAGLSNVVEVQIVEPDGAGLVSVAHVRGLPAHKIGGPFRLQPPPAAQPAVAEQADRLVIWHPIVAGATVGWVRMTSDIGAVAATRAAIWRSSLVLGGLWVAGGSTLLLLLLRPTGNDIRRLAAFARDLGGATGERVDVARGPSEIAELGAALNAASAELVARERELLAERERLDVTLRSIGEAVVVADTRGTTTLVNRAAEQLTGWAAAEAVGAPVAEVCRLADEQGGPLAEHPAAAALRTGAAAATPDQALLLPRQGEARNVVGNSAPVRDRQGNLLGSVTVVRDVTERATLERQLRQAQKMEAVGQLAGGIAHDFNNILTAIMGYGTIAQARAGGDEQLRGHLGQILEAAERAAHLTQSLLAFSRKQVMQLRVHDLGGIVRGVEKILRRLIREDIALRVRLHPGPLPVLVDRGQIEQVLLNLVTNARDALPRGGEIRIETAAAPGEGEWASLAVSDTGVGMSREVREKIFEPFFTTKEVGKGTGLGLAMVYGIVTQHRGRIGVESEPGAGASFRVLLPLAREAAEAGAAGAAGAAPPGGSETVLLVEDDRAVREVTRAVLEGAGYRVLAAEDGEEGCRLFGAEGDRVDLLLSDVVMPGCGGGEVLRRLRARRPGLRALFMSGYASDPATVEYLRDAGVRLLAKPIRREELLRAVRDTLDSPAS